jgi:hypothetical protein
MATRRFLQAIDLGDPGCAAGVKGCLGVEGDAGLFGGHPRIKQPVGARLADLARAIIHNISGIPLRPALVGLPARHGMSIELDFGNAAQGGVQFANTTMCGLFGSKSGKKGICCNASPFEMKAASSSPPPSASSSNLSSSSSSSSGGGGGGGGGQWIRTLMPKIEDGKVTIPLPADYQPTHLRYAWADTPMCMLYRAEDCSPLDGELCAIKALPVIPFNITLPASTHGGSSSRALSIKSDDGAALAAADADEFICLAGKCVVCAQPTPCVNKTTCDQLCLQDLMFVCLAGQCVPYATGLPLATCKQGCGPM